jgi:hypothetical protein
LYLALKKTCSEPFKGCSALDEHQMRIQDGILFHRMRIISIRFLQKISKISWHTFNDFIKFDKNALFFLGKLIFINIENYVTQIRPATSLKFVLL